MNILVKSVLPSLFGVALLSTVTAVSAQTTFPDAEPSVIPSADAFYNPPSPSELAAVAPGTLLRYRATPNKTYASTVKNAYQLMFRTTDSHGKPVAAVTTLLIPTAAPASAGRQLLSYQAFYDSLSLDCSPSALVMTGKLFEKGYINPALKAGVAVLFTDYEGLESQWIAGLNAGHTVLDGIRAAQGFSLSGLSSSTPVALMGYSGGAHATGWANELANEYAPELNIVGAALGGVPVNPINVAKKVDGKFFAPVYFGAVVGLSRAYPEIDPKKYATAEGLAMIADMGKRCLLGTLQGQPEMLIAKYMFQKSSKYLKDPNFLDLPEIQAIGRQIVLGTRVPKAPMYLYQGQLDEIMPLADVDALVATYCAAGQKVQYNRPLLADHLSLGVSTIPSMNYVLDRLNGKPAPTNCK